MGGGLRLRSKAEIENRTVCFTMLHGSFRDCYERVMFWKEKLDRYRRGEGGMNVYAYAQPYRDPYGKNEVPQWQKDMARWADRKWLFSSVRFEDYEPRKGFKCVEYFNN